MSPPIWGQLRVPVPRCGISSKLRSAKRHASVAFKAAFCEATSERLGGERNHLDRMEKSAENGGFEFQSSILIY